MMLDVRVLKTQRGAANRTIYLTRPAESTFAPGLPALRGLRVQSPEVLLLKV